MNLKIGKSNGRTYLSIVHGYRDTTTKKVRTKTIQSLGYLDELEKQFDDPIAHFRKIVEEMNRQEAEQKLSANICIDPNAMRNAPVRSHLRGRLEPLARSWRATRRAA